MLTIHCNDRQLPTQLARHHANALLAALRTGPKFERPGTPWRVSARTPNAPVNLPYSPVYEDLRANGRKIERLERLVALSELTTPADRAKLTALLSEQERLVQLARDAIWKEADWPYVAGLYAVRVPALRVRDPQGEAVEHQPFTVYRPLDVSDHDPLWPALSAILTREPRNTPTPAPAFAVETNGDSRLYARKRSTPATVADWLVKQVAELEIARVGRDAGDHYGEKNAGNRVENATRQAG